MATLLTKIARCKPLFGPFCALDMFASVRSKAFDQQYIRGLRRLVGSRARTDTGTGLGTGQCLPGNRPSALSNVGGGSNNGNYGERVALFSVCPDSQSGLKRHSTFANRMREDTTKLHLNSVRASPSYQDCKCICTSVVMTDCCSKIAPAAPWLSQCGGSTPVNHYGEGRQAQLLRSTNKPQEVLPSKRMLALPANRGRPFSTLSQRQPNRHRHVNFTHGICSEEVQLTFVQAFKTRPEVAEPHESVTMKQLSDGSSENAAWLIRLANENGYLSWCRNVYIATIASATIMTQEQMLPFAKEAATVIILMGALNLLSGTFNFVYNIITLRHRMLLSSLSVGYNVLLALLHMLLWCGAIAIYLGYVDDEEVAETGDARGGEGAVFKV